MDSCIKGERQAKGIWKQGPEVNIWAQEGYGSGEGFTMRNFIVSIVQLI